MAGEETAPKSGCCNGKMILQMILFGIWTPIAIALIVVGAIHKNDCPAENYIPIYMIVAGAFSFAYWILLPLECCFPTLRRILGILVALFVFAWFIAGSVWVFRIYDIPNRPSQCHNGMYLFVFSILIIQYIFIGLGIIAGLFSCFCCENSCLTKICSYFQTCVECCPCLACCQCTNCLESCQCLQCCNCLQGCNCLDSCSCLQCLNCSDCSKCLQCCDCFKSLCCCCKSIQCSSCLNCSMCTQCCKCLQCCAAKV